jgi:hypothetical protein
MSQDERRQYRRARLRLRIARMEGLQPLGDLSDLWTTDVSAGGMYFHAGFGEQPDVGAALSFEMHVPPGEGYSTSAGKVRGSGRVIRLHGGEQGATGVAVQFTRPLAFDF